MRITLNIPTPSTVNAPAIVATIESSEQLLAEDCLHELLPAVSAIDERRGEVVDGVITELVRRRCNA